MRGSQRQSKGCSSQIMKLSSNDRHRKMARAVEAGGATWYPRINTITAKIDINKRDLRKQDWRHVRSGDQTGRRPHGISGCERSKDPGNRNGAALMTAEDALEFLILAGAKQPCPSELRTSSTPDTTDPGGSRELRQGRRSTAGGHPRADRRRTLNIRSHSWHGRDAI